MIIEIQQLHFDVSVVLSRRIGSLADFSWPFTDGPDESGSILPGKLKDSILSITRSKSISTALLTFSPEKIKRRKENLFKSFLTTALATMLSFLLGWMCLKQFYVFCTCISGCFNIRHIVFICQCLCTLRIYNSHILQIQFISWRVLEEKKG